MSATATAAAVFSAPPVAAPRIAAGSPEFKRTNRALFFGGFSCFALLYCVQPLMPVLSHEFALTAAQSSMVLSISTGALAFALLASSVLSERLGRKTLMVAALALSAVLTVLCAFSHGYGQLLALRALMGLTLGGIPAIAMAYLGEEIEPASLGLSMGLYISGSAFGGMAGRVVSSVLSDYFSWRLAMAAMGVSGLFAAWEFWRSLPQSRHFTPSRDGWRAWPAAVRSHLLDKAMPWLFLLAFLLMGAYVSLYNYINYRLQAAPYGLGQSAMGAISFMYLLGMYSSVWSGRLADRMGRRGVLWAVMTIMIGGLLLTLSSSLVLILLGIALYTFGFFATHSVASSWVGRRALSAKAVASALYLFCYYMGSSVVGSATGIMWGRGGWNGVVAVLAAALMLALVVALRLRQVAPVGQGELAQP
jgi:YNFM family putative membrane transporter